MINVIEKKIPFSDENCFPAYPRPLFLNSEQNGHAKSPVYRMFIRPGLKHLMHIHQSRDDAVNKDKQSLTYNRLLRPYFILNCALTAILSASITSNLHCLETLVLQFISFFREFSQ